MESLGKTRHHWGLKSYSGQNCESVGEVGTELRGDGLRCTRYSLLCLYRNPHNGPQMLAISLNLQIDEDRFKEDHGQERVSILS